MHFPEILLSLKVCPGFTHHFLYLKLLLNHSYEIVKSCTLKLHVSEVMVLIDGILTISSMFKLYPPLGESLFKQRNAFILKEIEEFSVEL